VVFACAFETPILDAVLNARIESRSLRRECHRLALPPALSKEGKKVTATKS